MRASIRRYVPIEICVVLVAAYLSGYFALSEHLFLGAFGLHFREFPNKGIRTIYLPMGWLECKIRRQRVCVMTPALEGTEFYPNGLP